MAGATKKTEISEIDHTLTWPIRHKVMWPNQPASYVRLTQDPLGLHYGLYHEKFLVGVVSLFIDGERAQFRKLAVLKEYQGMGYGRKLLAYVLEVCLRFKITTVWCNARRDKIDFYTKYNFKKTNKEFVKGGISYCILEKSIT